MRSRTRGGVQRFHHLLTTERCSPHNHSPVDVFAILDKRVCTLLVGESLLDAGCSFGFLPLIVAERVPTLTKVVGVDIRTDPFPVRYEDCAGGLLFIDRPSS